MRVSLIDRLKIRYYFEHPKWRLLASQVLAQALLFISLPFISRGFPALEIGQWSVFQSFALFLWSFSQLKTDISLIQADTEEERRGLVLIGLTLHLLISAGSVILLGGTDFGQRLGATDLWLLLIYLAGLGFNQMVQSYLLSRQLYGGLISVRLLTPLLSFPGSLLLMLLQVPNGLVIGLVIGVWIPAIRPFYQSKMAQSWRLDHLPTLKTYWYKYKQNATIGSANALISVLADQVLILIIANYFNAGMVAAYYMAFRFCTTPVSLVAGSMGQYNFQIYQQLYKKGQFSSSVPIAYWKKWLPIAVIYYGTLIIFGREIFGFVLGQEWAYAGYLAALLAVPSALIFLTSPTSSAFTVIQKQEYVLALSAGTLLRLLCIVLVAFYDQRMETFVLVHAISGILYTLLFNGVMLFAINAAQKNKSK